MTFQTVLMILGMILIFVTLPITIGNLAQRVLIKRQQSKLLRNILITLIGLFTWVLIQVSIIRPLDQSMLISTPLIGLLYYLGAKYYEIKWEQNQKVELTENPGGDFL